MDSKPELTVDTTQSELPPFENSLHSHERLAIEKGTSGINNEDNSEIKIEDMSEEACHNSLGDLEDGEKKIRRSTRDIKRPKFDDELVDSSSTGRSGIAGLLSPKKRYAFDQFNQGIESLEESVSASSSTNDYTQSWTNFASDTLMETDEISHLFEAGTSSTTGTDATFDPHTYQSQQLIIRKTDMVEETQEPSTTKLGVGLRKRNTISIEDRQAMEDALMEEEAARLEKKRREARIASKDVRAKELAAANEAAEALAADDLNSWSTADDVALVTAVSHVCDLVAVHSNIMFNKEYSLPEIEERWYQLMYDDTLSRQAKRRMNELPVQDILRIQSTTVFSVREEDILKSISSQPVPDMGVMADVLRKYPEDFHSARTPQVLLDHWHLMKISGLLTGQAPRTVAPIDWDRIEKNTSLAGDIVFDETRALRAASQYDSAQKEWAKVGVQHVTGVVNDTEWAPGVVAAIRGRVVRFLIRSDKVTLGRTTYKSTADVNLALEGPALKVSRRQAIIARQPSGEFWLQNTGSRAVFVDGKTVQQGQNTGLRDGAVIEISLMRLVFRIATR